MLSLIYNLVLFRYLETIPTTGPSRLGVSSMSNPQWISAAAPIVAGLVTALAAVWTFSRQRTVERRKDQELLATRLVTPFLFAAEDLQSRLYNITQLKPESIMSADQWTSFGTETLLPSRAIFLL